MEPLRGGWLAKLPKSAADELKAMRPDEDIPAWGFRFLQSVPAAKSNGKTPLPFVRIYVYSIEILRYVGSDPCQLIGVVISGDRSKFRQVRQKFC